MACGRSGVIVIGSRLGRSVAALRVVDQGYRVGVMGSGTRWLDEDVPTTSWDIRRFVWQPELEMFSCAGGLWYLPTSRFPTPPNDDTGPPRAPACGRRRPPTPCGGRTTAPESTRQRPPHAGDRSARRIEGNCREGDERLAGGAGCVGTFLLGGHLGFDVADSRALVMIARS